MRQDSETGSTMAPKTSSEPPEFGFFDGEEIYKTAPEKAPIIEGFLYEKDVSLIIAAPKTGKSILLLQIMFALTTGTPLFGIFPVLKKCRVLFLQAEGDRCETVERINNMKKALKIDDDMWTHCNVPGLAMNKEKPFVKFLEDLRKRGKHYDVIIIDPLYTTIQGNLSDPEAVTAWQNNIRVLCGEYGCAMIVAAHPPKPSVVDGKMQEHSDAAFGSTFWGAYVNQTISFTKHTGYHALTTSMQRSEKIFDRLELVLIEPSPLMFTLREENMIASEANVVKMLTDRGPLKMRALEHVTKLSRATVYRATGMLMDKKKIKRNKDGSIELIKVDPSELM